MDNLLIAVIAGVLVFAISQYLLKFIFEPILEYRKTLSEISHTLLLNQATIMNGGPNDENLKASIHALSAKLMSFLKIIPFFNFLQKAHIFSLPSEEKILLACHGLNLIGYGVIDCGIPQDKRVSQNIQTLDELRTLLDIDTTYTRPKEEP